MLLDRLPDPSPRRRFPPSIVEILIVTAIFASAGSWPAPDTNESHYLAKARHFADPAWCAGDFFLETPEAHHVFYRVIGPVASALPLSQAAWIGRIAGWLALAVGIEWALVNVVEGTAGVSRWRLLAAAIWSLAVRHAAASGEWVIGGCEGKVFAWAGVLGAVGFFAAGSSAAAWACAGCATAMHALVGGWGMVATAMAAVVSRLPVAAPARPDASVGDEPGSPWWNAAMMVVGLAAAAVGVVPALSLSRGVSPPEAAEAVRIYVVERLSHHLVVETFADGMLARHMLAAMLAVACMAIAPRSRQLDRLAMFVGMAVAIALAGCLVSLAQAVAPATARSLLRFYWFRLSDGLLPLLLAAAATLALRARAGSPAGRACLVAVLAVVAIDLANESRHWPLPGRSLPARADRHLVPPAWEEICGWVKANTPPGSRFITPRGSASFQWRAERPEVVSWKHVPQNLAGVLEWRRRLLDCFSPQASGSLRNLDPSTASIGAERVREVADRYDADYIIVPLVVLDRGGPLPFERLHANDAYAVYRVR